MNVNTGGWFSKAFSAATRIERHELKATLLSFVFVLRWVKETKGMHLEDMQRDTRPHEQPAG